MSYLANQFAYFLEVRYPMHANVKAIRDAVNTTLGDSGRLRAVDAESPTVLPLKTRPSGLATSGYAFSSDGLGGCVDELKQDELVDTLTKLSEQFHGSTFLLHAELVTVNDPESNPRSYRIKAASGRAGIDCDILVPAIDPSITHQTPHSRIVCMNMTDTQYMKLLSVLSSMDIKHKCLEPDEVVKTDTVLNTINAKKDCWQHNPDVTAMLDEIYKTILKGDSMS